MEAGKKRLATLVGCNYANTRNELHGCINDVVAMRDVLVRRFGFEMNNIEFLTDLPDSLTRPTGANIRRALARMVDVAEPGDVLFFHYSGHGTLIPPVKPYHHGIKRDEAIVPCDFNLITDVDFRQLVDRLPAGVSFTIISDSCHSGGLIDKEKEQIGPSTATDVRETTTHRRHRTIPFESILQELSSLSGLNSPHIADHLLQLFGPETSVKFSANSGLRWNPRRPDDGILLSGCQMDETSADVNAENSESGKACGAFSNSIQMVLREHGGLISNAELVSRARRVLREQGFAQHPCLYCSDDNADAPFLWQPQETTVKLYSTL